MRGFKHVNAKSVEEISSLLGEYKEKAAVLAGGTDLVGEMKDDILPDYPEVVISLRSVPGLEYIKEEDGFLKIGALTVLHDLEKDKVLAQKYTAITEAAHAVASPHIRHMGTIGGNICQENRCWYYRDSNNRFNCLRKGGQECFALVGENQNHSIFGAGKIEMTPCSKECPANTDIPAYMDKIRKGDIAGAASILLRFNPIPCITGRVCPHKCQDGCGRHCYDSSVSVRNVERYLGDYALQHSDVYYAAPAKENDKKVVVVGSGPAGLSAAYFLRRQGCSVTVLEKNEECGGVLRYGIPPYRLPKPVVKKTVDAIAGMGVTFKTGMSVGRDVLLEDLMKKNDAVFLGYGAWVEHKMDIEGEELATSSLDFLKKINSGDRIIPKGKVAVVGGGNAAMDVARSALRLGAHPVVLYRRSEAEMPAIHEDVQKAKEDGVEFQFLTLPVKASGRSGAIDLECVKMALGEPDEKGRPRPVKIPGSEYTERFDAVIKGIGQSGDTGFVPGEFLERGRLKGSRDIAHVGGNLFAGGDVVTGPATVVEALAAGRNAMLEIADFLKIEAEAPAYADVDYGLYGGANLGRKDSMTTNELSVEERIKSIDVEDESGLDSEIILKEEAGRCLNCGCVAVAQADMGPALVALDAIIKTTKREIPAGEFFTVRKYSSTALDDDELVTEVAIPEPKKNTKQTYIKFAARKSIDFPVISVAAAVTLDEAGKVKSARIVMSGVAPVPLRAKEAENYLIGKKPGEEDIQEAANIALHSAHALSKNAHKIPATRAIVKKALLKVLA